MKENKPVERMKAPLCHRCAGILHGTVLNLTRLSGDTENVEKCPWCQKNKPDAIYQILTNED